MRAATILQGRAIGAGAWSLEHLAVHLLGAVAASLGAILTSCKSVGPSKGTSSYHHPCCAYIPPVLVGTALSRNSAPALSESPLPLSF